MTGERDGSGGTSGRDGAEPARPRTVPLDDLFGVTPSVTDEQDPPAIRAADPTGGEPDESVAEPPAVPGWDTSPHQVSFAALSGADEAPTTATDPPAAWSTGPAADGAADGAAAPAPVCRLTLDGPDPDPGPDLDPASGESADGGVGGAGPGSPRVVSFEELSGRGVRRSGPRRDGATARRRPAAAAGATDRAAAPEDTGPDPVEESTTPRGRRRGESRGRGRRRGEDDTPRVETPQEQETRARDICLRLLTDRARTVKELGDALRRKEIPDEVAHRVLDRFDEVGLVDDQAFAEQWVRSRHRHRGLGKRAIAMELHRKGVDREIADEALTGIDDDSERDRARELVVRRLRSLPVGSREERQSSARKLVGMLARKGYGPGVAYGVVKEEIAAAGAEADELGEAPPED